MCAQLHKNEVVQNTVHFQLYSSHFIFLNMHYLAHQDKCMQDVQALQLQTHHSHITDNIISVLFGHIVKWQVAKTKHLVKNLSNTDALSMWAKQNLIQKLEFPFDELN